jgi:hypothetical protein
MAWDTSKYTDVNTRITQFWEAYPNGRIHTEIVLINEREVVIKASAFTDRDDQRPASIDFAQESVADRGVNSTSWVENCSTSAIGRCLATLGFSPRGGARASIEEMQKVVRVYKQKADAYALAGDIQGLRSLLADAQANKAAAEAVDHIVRLGQELGKAASVESSETAEG